MIMNHTIVPLKRLGLFKDGNDATFSLQRECWNSNFTDGQIPEGQKPIKNNRIYSAGCYCFWWIGTTKSLENYNAQHYIKGKQTSLEDVRISNTHSKVVKIDFKKDGSRRKTPIHHVYHPIKWKFKEMTIQGLPYVPLYIGKSSHIFNRIASHLRWAKDVDMWDELPVLYYSSDGKSHYEQERLVRVKKPRGNTVAQFRAGFKFLRQQGKHENLSDIVIDKNIGLSIYKNDFDAVEERFFMEGMLIDRLRPPFNIDSER